jgi:EAL domain-containing protein (putative c-di-GMP-specific phosphodiesterase class I)
MDRRGPIPHHSRGALKSTPVIERGTGLGRGAPSASQLSLDEVRSLARLRLALRSDSLRLVAQPIVELATGEVMGHEVLVRLAGAGWTQIEPGRFLAAAERTGQVVQVDRWVLERAIGLAAAGHRVHVNVSACSICQIALVDEIESALERHGADPARLTLEITETMAMHDLDAARSFAERFTAIGGRLALDDFGTGFGGLVYLKHLPITMLKIDVEFVHDLVANPRSREIVGCVARLGADLGHTTVAEGVQDEPTYEALREIGVDCAQGFHVARPVPIVELGPSL